MDADEPGLVRYWFTFDLEGHKPVPPPPGVVQLDGDTPTYRLLGRGVGVTGYDEADCLRMIARELGHEPPTVISTTRNPTVPARTGNPAWRGIWWPPLNLRGPVAG